jgi:hypothetical protein
MVLQEVKDANLRLAEARQEAEREKEAIKMESKKQVGYL